MRNSYDRWHEDYETKIVEWVANKINNMNEDNRLKEIRYLISSLYTEYPSDSYRYRPWSLVEDYDVKKRDFIEEF